MAKDTNAILEKYNKIFSQEVIVKVDDNTLAEQEVDIEVQEGNEVNGKENVSDEHFSKEELAILDRVIKEEIDADKSYLEKAELVESEAIADMFRCIAKEEVQHQILLENLRKGEFYTRELPIETREVSIDPQEVSENDKMYIELLMQEEQDAMKSYAEAVQLSNSQILQENFVEIGDDEKKHFAMLGKALHGEVEVEDVAKEVVDLIEDGIKVDVVNKHYDEEQDNDVINLNQEQEEITLESALDEIININKEKGEGEGMAIKKELDAKAEDIKEVPTDFEAQEKKDTKEEAEEKVEEAKKVEEEEKKEEAEDDKKDEKKEDKKVEEACIENCNNMEADKQDDKKDEKFDDDEDDKDDDDDDKEDKKDDKKVEEACNCDMSKADKKTYEATIETLRQNLKKVKAELEVAKPYKALYEEEVAKVKKLEAYKEDVELDRLRTDKMNYAKTCNFDALEDEDKEVVQEKIDNYSFSLYDFKAFMADVLNKYSKKQVYANMEKVISYFSIEDKKDVVEDVAMPSDKNMADRILDKYSDAIN